VTTAVYIPRPRRGHDSGSGGTEGHGPAFPPLRQRLSAIHRLVRTNDEKSLPGACHKNPSLSLAVFILALGRP
jgi:hypothetical protein